MPEPTREKGPSDRGKPRSELTSNQLIIGICLFLVAAMVCFMLGVVVGKFEGKPGPSAQRGPSRLALPALRTEDTPRESAGRDADREDARGEGTQAYPRPVLLPTVEPAPERPPLPSRAAIDLGRSAAPEKGPPEVQLSELPEPGDAATVSLPSVGEAEQAQAGPESAPREDAVVEGAVVPDEGARADRGASPPVEPTDEASAEALLAPAAEPSSVPKPPATTPSEEGFGVQVAAFSGPNRQGLAEGYKERLEDNSELKAVLLASEDGQYVRVVVGGYPDRQTAVQVRDELRQRAGFRDCFVRSLP